MSVDLSHVLDVTGKRAPYSSKSLAFACTYNYWIPPDLLTYMEQFGRGDYNMNLAIRPPERWRLKVHESYFSPTLSSGFLPDKTIEGVCFAETTCGDELVASGVRQGVVLKSRLYGGFWPLGERYADVLQGIFMPKYWDVMRASKVFFNSAINRHPHLTLRIDTPLVEVKSKLASLDVNFSFMNEQAVCLLFFKQLILVSLQNSSIWGKGSNVVVTVGSSGANEFMLSLKKCLDELGFE